MNAPLAAITLRPITDADMAFLYTLYASTREAEMALVAWTDKQKNEFLSMQFKAQHSYYTEHFQKAHFDVIENNAQPIGRLYVDRRDDEIRVIDIALLPQFRGQGTGRDLMKSIVDEAASSGLCVGIHVENNNPALHLYQRLGFRHVDNQGVYSHMEWRQEKTAS